MKRRSLILAFSVSLAGCFDAHGLEPIPDAGGDAPSPTPDAPASCSAGLVWLDAEPLDRPSDVTPLGAPAMAADADGFLVLAVNHTGILDLAHCITVDGIPARSTVDHVCSGFAPTWSAETPPRVFASSDPAGRIRIAVTIDDELYWSRGPDFDVADGTVPFDRVLGAVAFEDDAVLIETHDPLTREGAFGPSERNAESVVTRHPMDGGAPTELSDLDPSFGFDHWAPRLASSSAGPWLAILNDVDFPPTVQVSGPGGGGWDGSSCGVESYDWIPGTDSVLVSQDCGGEVQLVRRHVDRAERDHVVIEGRDAASGIGSRIASDGEHVAVTYRARDGETHVAIFDPTLTLLVDGVVPVRWAAPEVTAGPLALAAMADGTFAVMTTHHRGSPYHGSLEVQRFRLCP